MYMSVYDNMIIKHFALSIMGDGTLGHTASMTPRVSSFMPCAKHPVFQAHKATGSGHASRTGRNNGTRSTDPTDQPANFRCSIDLGRILVLFLFEPCRVEE